MITLHNDFKNYYKEIYFEYGLGLCSSFPGLIHLKKTTMAEIWKDIEGYEEIYQVSDLGRIKSLSITIKNGMGNQFISKTIILNGKINQYGYIDIGLYKLGVVKFYKAHRIVALAFIPNPENKPTVNHKWGDKLDNRSVALEWATYAENTQHSFKVLGRRAPQGKHSTSSKPVLQLSKEGEILNEYVGMSDAERKTGIIMTGISKACMGKQKTCGGYLWKYA